MTNLHRELLQLEESGYIPNYSSFYCTICLEQHDENGVTLNNCLHTFCKMCITKVIQYTDEAVIKCPYKLNNINCAGILMDREIKGLLTRDQYEKHLAKSLQIAENRAANSFHCLTPNCNGWCINEDNRLSLFMCPICLADNCIKCNAIHTNLNCLQYTRNTSEFKTKTHLDELITNRTGMACPSCKIIITKNGGCNHMVCRLCKHSFNWTGL